MNESTTQTKTINDAATFARRVGTGVSQLAGAAVSCVARAPIALDVMGGIAELSGALTLAVPCNEAVRVALAPRTDQHLNVVASHAGAERAGRNGHGADQSWELAAFYAGDAPAPIEAIREKVAGVDGAAQKAVLAAAHALLLERVVPHYAGGWTVYVESEREIRADAAFLSAVQAATAAALTRATGSEIDAARISSACRVAQNELLACPTGIMSQAAPLLGKPGELLQVTCSPFAVCDSLRLPNGVALVGIDCGTRHEQTHQKCAAAFTAALMGREIIARLMPEVCGAPMWDGYLARVSITDFVDHLRDCIPTKLKGSQFLERFGPLDNAPIPIEPNVIYKVRSRAEHHIYEEDRVRQFADRITRARRSGDDNAIIEAGELMYASHWSYGQRCGLGSIESDALVSLLRSAGSAAGIYGARISGTGCGGTVVVLIRDDDAAIETIEGVMRTYQQRTKCTPRLHRAAEEGAPGFLVEQLA
ncbi:MAG: hypothetical protein H6817_05025 [Phycisphaerales bacterium]|nr:hypothetical protein [Phycisphaerales bacterium]